jgi:hypothetical protein
MRLAMTIAVAVLATGCAAQQDPDATAVMASWEPLPAPSDVPFAGASDTLELALGEPVEIDGFLYEVVDVRRWDRSTSDETWCLAVQIHEEIPDPDATDPLVGWTVRDDAGDDHFFDFGCADGTDTPERPVELAADELQPGMAAGDRYWIVFDLPDSREHFWLFRTRKDDGVPALTLQLT